MSLFFLILALFLTFLIIILFFELQIIYNKVLFKLQFNLKFNKSINKNSNKTINNKITFINNFSKKNIIDFIEKYKLTLHSWNKPIFSKINFYTFSFYILLNLLIPFWGLTFYLNSDANFLVVVVSIIVSLQLHQRLYYN